MAYAELWTEERSGWLLKKIAGYRKKDWEEARKRLLNTRGHLATVHLIYCIRTIDTILAKMDRVGFIESSDIAKLEDNLQNELTERVFISISAVRQAYFRYPLNGWESVIEAFPDAQVDVEEMNKCFALSRYTAAVFHSLLVVEHGLIELGKRIKVTDPKLGWDATYNRLGLILKDRRLLPAGVDFGFLEQAKARLDSMKLAWRNKVTHAAGRVAIEQSGFSDVSAEEVVIACRSFMRLMAEGLS